MNADRWMKARALLRAADPRMAALVDARPDLDPDAFLDTCHRSRGAHWWLRQIGQQISLAAAAAIRGRFEALCGGALPAPEQRSRSTRRRCAGSGSPAPRGSICTTSPHDWSTGGSISPGSAPHDDDTARVELTQIEGVARFMDGVLLLTLRRAHIWPTADLSLRRARVPPSIC
jgi:hypothetical protein